ncbi:MAG: hypothetical protein EBR79_02195, partial [Proteobacteria bacterium]|nr:hypothetical protein [Pseudomonadota bacterium]
MSWQRGQGFGTGRGQPLAAMGLAALLAANKPLVEQQLREGLRQLENVPSDIDALAFAAGVARYGAIEGELGPRPL